jgi:hypothetical protein
MINILRHIAARSAATAVVAMLMANTLHAQAPTDAQRSAIRSQCRSDYIAHCSSVPPGGIESLQCLQKNMSSLSASCKSAVNAVEAPAAAPKAETPAAEPAKPAEAAAPKAAEPAKTTAPAAKTAASAPAKKPSDAQVAAIRSACRSDYQKTCAGVPPGGAAALSCLEKNKAKLSPSCEQAVSAASGGSAPATAAAPASGGAAGASPAAPATVIVLRPMRPREELFVLRSACGADVRGLCAGIPPGGGRIMQCLATQAASLSPACKDVLTSFAAQ